MSFLNPGNAAQATEYLSDKIVGIYQGVYTPATQTTTLGGLWYRYAIPHSFTRPTFVEIKWSTDGITYYDGGSPNPDDTQAAIGFSDSSNIYIMTIFNTGVIYYKAICSWIDDYDTTNPSITPVLNTTSGLYFDSRKNYPKINTQAITILPPLVGTGTTTIFHGMSYVPRVKAYFEAIQGQVWPLNAGGTRNLWYYDPSQQVEASILTDITTIQVSYNTASAVSGSDTRKLWYRVYI